MLEVVIKPQLVSSGTAAWQSSTLTPCSCISVLKKVPKEKGFSTGTAPLEKGSTA